jgi:membrane associated rhomboid family serine protease
MVRAGQRRIAAESRHPCQTGTIRHRIHGAPYTITGRGSRSTDVIPLKDDIVTDRVPVATYVLIAANVLAFLWQLDVGVELSAFRGGAIPYEILTFSDTWPRDLVPPPFTILTSMFLHGSWMHLGFNMLSLWIFGNNVEDALGHVRYVAFYVLAGIAAALAQTFASAAAGDLEVPMVGASGAIAGVLAGYLVLFPRSRVLTAVILLIFVRLMYLPARFFIIGWFVIQVVSAVFGGAPGVAFFAHIGGFVAGYLIVRIVGRRPTWRARRFSW